MVYSSNLGFPRVGANRELKKLIESYWAGKVTQEALLQGAKEIRVGHWKLQQEKGIDHIPSGDFSLYDHILDNSITFGVIPQKYQHLAPGLETYFAMGRGLQKPAVEGAAKIDVPAMEMKKWFDTNYHYIVPEFQKGQQFTLAKSAKVVNEFLEAKELGIHTRPVIVGPISYLLLGKTAKDSGDFDKLSLLPSLVSAYEQLLQRLAEAGATWVQVDEPFLSLDLTEQAKSSFKGVYETLSKASSSLKLLVATYFSQVGDNTDVLTSLPVAAIHVDLVRAPQQLDTVLEKINSTQILSLGLVNGRNIWKTNLAKALESVQKAVSKLGGDRVIVAPSCSLLHSPHSIEGEKKIEPEILDWLSFAVEKLREVTILAKAVDDAGSVKAELEANSKSIQARATSPRIHNPVVQDRLKNITPEMFKRNSPFPERRQSQEKKLGLPKFATTTVGSFPQTKEVRLARSKVRKGDWSQEEYDSFIKSEIEKTVRFQEDIGLDVLVHGESERNDMVEYFGENLDGYVFTQNGWVASYGTRCVKPPIIFGDIHRPKPMTVDVIKYAQSLTQKPMKGMLTGPITCLQWSFVRDDQPRQDTAFQLALAIRDEVQDLEKAGIPVIQIDEPAIREGLPLRQNEWKQYLQWAVDAFLLSSVGVEDSTQIHTHMCYSDFNDIFPSIKRMDADVITIENSKSDLKLLSAFETHSYTNWIGPGLYDIHSPRVPSVEEMEARLGDIVKLLPNELVWVNPDCGLKTRGWVETEAALKNLVAVARAARKQY
ncbi:cobalamin-independent methionine synthase [Basidiobolus meristosporus CBS 931.73]|uniref:5-methyltetrahydropteroyltriglutamate--homocysteine S-methyltransferase n=1 Tax=Basidiobolus meristosporus CBS 931.73 TaxID=1314790 RepID=A0A1Y1YSS2_9FUNG|nr:cobalamin-independent methionine synthase [Basidiobolus meristosporus CBS 931.73]|eukprot:ORY01078.1 cobalamin-independent methionine synthase [Basidiobolus meristosporus CBS 931.73]